MTFRTAASEVFSLGKDVRSIHKVLLLLACAESAHTLVGRRRQRLLCLIVRSVAQR